MRSAAIADVRRYIKSINHCSCTALLSCLLAACGGGGYNSGAPNTPPPVTSAAPSITAQPQAQSVTEGDSVQFTVTATGDSLAYQWSQDGVNIAGATGATYAIGSATLDLNGASFSVAVSNGAGQAQSAAAMLTVAAKPPGQNAAGPQVAAGANHTCVVASDGTVYCWGSNASGQLGVEGGDTATPTAVAGLSGIKIAARTGSIAAGRAHTCAVTQNSGLVYCWGDNNNGQLGNGSLTASSEPGAVAGLSGVRSLAATSNGMCAVVDTAASTEIQCWGLRVATDDAGRVLLVGSRTPVREDSRVLGGLLIAGGNRHYCATSRSGRTLCWGVNLTGQLGADSSTTSAFVPSGAAVEVGIGDTSAALALAVGNGHSCAIVDGETPSPGAASNIGTVMCWGTNSRGQLGVVGGVLESSSPLPAQYGSSLGGILVPSGTLYASALSVGTDHGCAIADDNRVHCWGDNEFLQVGLAPADTGKSGLTSIGVRNVPTGLESIDVMSVAAGGDHTCAITGQGTVKCWGRNDSGQLGRDAGDPQTAGDVVGLPTL